jgi:hypothetical protein
MKSDKHKLSVRSVSDSTRARLVALKGYTRLTYGALLDDAVTALWDDNVDDDHDLPIIDD